MIDENNRVSGNVKANRERQRYVVAFYLRVILYSCFNKIIIIIIIIILSLILDTFLSSSFNLRMLCVGKFGHYMFRPE